MTNTPPASPFEIFSSSPLLVSPRYDSNRLCLLILHFSSGKRKNKNKKKQLMKEVSFQQTSAMKKRNSKSGRASINDFLGSI